MSATHDCDLLVIAYIHDIEKKYNLSTNVPQEIITLILFFFVIDIADLVHLEGDINLDTICDIIRYKYFKKNNPSIYTSISNVLLAINPYQSLSNTKDIMDEYIESQRQGQIIRDKAHPYSVASRAYSRMIKRKCNQSIIISGQSGSGKVSYIHYVHKSFKICSYQILIYTIDRNSEINH